jgi:adenylate cyclase class 2
VAPGITYHSSMPVEIEAKVRVADFTTLRRRLRELGAKSLGKNREINRFYDTPNHALRRKDSGVRIRTSVHSDKGVSHVVTFKGPRQASKYKLREELEFTTDDPDATAAVFERLGYQFELSFEKRRESWQLGRCKIELDELPQLGKFLEVEGPSERVIGPVLAKLGLQDQPSLTRGYASMVSHHLAAAKKKELKFGRK